MRLDLKLMRFSAAMSSAALTMGVLVFGGYWGGHRLDVWLHTSPLFALVLMIVGIFLGLFWIVFVAQKIKL